MSVRQLFVSWEGRSTRRCPGCVAAQAPGCLALPLNAPDKTISFTTYLYLSGTTFFTLGLDDVTPLPGAARLLVVIEVALGFIFLALVISYVPIIYQAFSRREVRISSELV
jgi:voltage-gated potassium channel Kch